MRVYEVVIEILDMNPEVKHEQHFVHSTDFTKVAKHFENYCNELSYEDTLYDILSIRYVLTVSGGCNAVFDNEVPIR